MEPLDRHDAMERLIERQQVLRRTLRGMPDAMVEALSLGLRRNANRLIKGRLFRAPSGGGCAVGVMLRELEPSSYRQRGLRFMLRHGWRRHAASYGGELARNPRLAHLEWSFDAAVDVLRELEPHRSAADAACAVGAWLRSAADEELAWRRLRDQAAMDGSAAMAPACGRG